MKNNEEKDLVSIVIPVYKVMEFLPRCVDSVLNQTYENIEILLIDDGSPDDCGKICDDYAKKDARVKVIHKKNGGLSDARNVGIENSKGCYICFVDSDDILDKNFVRYHYESITETESDVSICLYQKFFEESEISTAGELDASVLLELDKHNLNLKLFEKQNIHYICACTKMCKKEIFETLRFEVGRLHEDEFIVYKIFDKANKAVMINLPLYFYRMRQGSITKAQTFKEKNLDAFYSIESCYKFYVNTEYEQTALNRLINSTAYIYCIAKRRKADKEILKFLLAQFKKYYKLNKEKTLKQILFNLFPNFVCSLKRV